MTTKYLFTIDLDGTLLKDSSTSEIDKRDIDAIQRLKAAGHIVCLVTGRPWKASKKAYDILKMDTIVANYNGARIHNPSDYDFVETNSYMNLNDVMYVLGDEKIKSAMSNLAIEGPGWVMLEKRDPDLEKIFGFSSASKLKIGINIHKLPLRPTGVIFDTKPGINVLELRDYMQRTYGDLVEFSSWSKGEGKTPVFDMTAVGVTKAKAIALMARYYDIPMDNTVAIGDGFNDIPMFQSAEISVAMKNSMIQIQRHATFVSSKTNKEAGVADFVNKFLGKDSEKFIKGLREKRKELMHIEDETTIAH